MCKKGAIANQALTLAFPIQILIIAIGVGTGIGLNALLSKSLGEKNKEKVNKVAGNGIFLSICIFIVFLLFGLFGSECFISLFVAMFFHYTKNKEINGNLKYIKPDIGIIKGIYKIGISAAIMQALLSVMMAGMNAILGGAKADPTILVGSFGIYYKIQQIALFSAFGLSNTIISILSFNYGMKDKERINDCIKYGIIDTAMVTFILTIIFEIFAEPLSSLFALFGGTSKEIIEVCTISLRIASIGYIYMGFSVAVQGILQSLGYSMNKTINNFFIKACCTKKNIQRKNTENFLKRGCFLEQLELVQDAFKSFFSWANFVLFLWRKFRESFAKAFGFEILVKSKLSFSCTCTHIAIQ